MRDTSLDPNSQTEKHTSQTNKMNWASSTLL